MHAIPLTVLRKGRHHSLGCPACGGLPPTVPENGSSTCQHCRRRLVLQLCQPGRRHGEQATVALNPDEAVCGNHIANKAVAACDGCGLFICSLCCIKEGDSTTYCPDCFEQRRQQGDLASTRTTITNYGHIALMLGLISIPFVFIGPLLGLAAIIIAWANKRQNRRLGERIGPVAGIFGMFFGLLGIVIGTLFYWNLLA